MVNEWIKVGAATKVVTSILHISPSTGIHSFSSSNSTSILLWKTTLSPLPEADLEHAGKQMFTKQNSLLEENLILHTSLPGDPVKLGWTAISSLSCSSRGWM